MKPQENENLQIEYPEVRQMKPGNHGYDYIIVNEHGVELRVEFKERDKTAKYDITKYQADHCDIFAMRDNRGELWFMSNKLYMSLCKKHSAWPKHQSKRWELSRNKFRSIASKDLYEIANSITPDYGTLEDFLGE